MIRFIFLVITGLILSACAVASPAEGTLTMQNATLGTEIAYVRQTATYEADLNNRTLEFLGTAQSAGQERQQGLVSTLQALGIPVDTSLVTPAAIAPRIADVAPVNNNAPGVGVTVIPPTFDPANPQPTPAPQVQAPAVDTSGPHVTNLVTSTGVGNDDCAVGVTNQFTSTSPEIYAVATANNFPAGITATFSWTRDGTVIYSDSFTWDFDINGACIWYFVTPSDFEFTPGNYTVQIENSGALMGTPATFTITGG